MIVVNVAEADSCFVLAHEHFQVTHTYMLKVPRSIVRNEQMMVSGSEMMSQSMMTAVTSKVYYTCDGCTSRRSLQGTDRLCARDAHGHATRA